MKVRVVFAMDYELPDTAEERMALYGLVDPVDCVRLDLDNDPALFLLDDGPDLVSAEVVA